MPDEAFRFDHARWSNTIPTVPTLAQMRELEDLRIWFEYTAPGVETLLEVGVRPTVIELLVALKIRSLHQLSTVAAVLRKHHGPEPLTDADWDTYYRTLSDELHNLSPAAARQLIDAYAAWARAYPEQDALLTANSARRVLPSRTRQIALAFLRDGRTLADIAVIYGVSRKQVSKMLISAGLYTDLRQLHRMNLAWTRKWNVQGNQAGVAFPVAAQMASAAAVGKRASVPAGRGAHGAVRR